MEPELECFEADTGKAGGFGELKGGMLFSVSLAMARRLLGEGKKLTRTTGLGKRMASGMEIVDELGSRVGFEIAVGRNGKVWIGSDNLQITLCVGRCIQEAEFLTGEEQKRLARAKLREFGLGV